MVKLAFVFPGQGSQYVGMGRELWDQFAVAREIFEQADAALGFPISRLCFEGPAEELNQTVHTQPAILTVSIAALKALQQTFPVAPAMLAGHSLGEYSAMVAAGAMTFTDAVRLVRQRGRLMQEAAPAGGMMAAVLGLGREQVIQSCRQAADAGTVEPANFNCPGQVVISGSAAGVNRAMELCKAAGAKRCIPLAVSGPFHSSYMQTAGRQLAEALARLAVADLAVPVVSNVTARAVKTAAEARALLAQGVYNPVRWEDCVQFMAENGITTMVEIGPGKVLTGLVKKISKEMQTMNIEDRASLEKVLAQFKEVV